MIAALNLNLLVLIMSLQKPADDVTVVSVCLCSDVSCVWFLCLAISQNTHKVLFT